MGVPLIWLVKLRGLRERFDTTAIETSAEIETETETEITREGAGSSTDTKGGSSSAKVCSWGEFS